MQPRPGLLQDLGFYRSMFAVAAAYDLILGLAFIFLYDPILDALDIVEPYNTSYIHLAAVFVAVQGIGYLFVWQDVPGNAGLVKTGIIYKAAYAGVAIYYLAIDDLLHWVFFLFGMLDLAFLVLFVGALRAIRSHQVGGGR